MGYKLLKYVFLLSLYLPTAGNSQGLSLDLDPLLAPPPTQLSLEIAILGFGIDVPSNVKDLYIDKDLSERGESIVGYGFCKVSIGLSAFESWAILGSTLAHEIEVHCNQNFFLYSILNLFGFDAEKLYERQAYLYEIANQDRFGLTDEEVVEIYRTMEFYYPDKR